MKLTFIVRWAAVTDDEYRLHHRPPGLTAEQLVRVTVEIVLAHNRGRCQGHRCWAVWLFQELSKQDTAAQQRASFVETRQERRLSYQTLCLQGAIDEVAVDDPVGLLPALELEPLSLLPNDLNLNHDQLVRLLAAPARG